MKGFINKIKNSPYYEEKKRFLLFGVSLIFVLFFSFFLLRKTFARYELRTKIDANIDRALYIFDATEMSFNLEPSGIVPSSNKYVYRFSVSNFNETKESDVDISYQIALRTTTNLPFTYELYRNELYTDTGARSILDGAIQVQDEDDAWYKVFNAEDEYEMSYKNHTTDTYSLVVSFPAEYATDTTYANYIESIEVIIKSKQIV